MPFWIRIVKHHKIDTLLVLAFCCTLIFGVAGWLNHLPMQNGQSIEHGQKWSLAFFRTFRAFVFGDEYGLPQKFEYDWRIIVAGWLGAFVAVGTLLKAVAKLFYGPLARLRSVLRRDHVVVFGDRVFAQKAAQALAATGRKVSHHTGLIENEHDGVLTVPRRSSLLEPFMLSSMKNAERIVVAETHDSATAETCLLLAKAWPKTPIFAVFENPWLAGAVRHTVDSTGDFLIAVSESAAIARTALVPMPPFSISSHHGQTRIHVLIVGLDRLGEALIEDLLNSNMILNQLTPRITILDNDMPNKKAAFLARHPHLIEQSNISTRGPIDMVFVQGDAGALEEASLRELKRALNKDPVTSVYVAVGEKHTPLAIALALQGVAQREGLFDAPILVPARNGCGITSVGTKHISSANGIYEFGTWDSLIMASGILDAKPDELAKLYHANYEQVVWEQDAANVNWKVLSEPFRVSNRRGAAHIPAKLASLNYDLNPFLESANALSPNASPLLNSEENLYKNDEECGDIAELEHERWMMDRWLNGWRYGATKDGKKDTFKKLHPDLIPYEQLSDYAKNKDMIFARWLNDWVKREDKNGIAITKQEGDNNLAIRL